MTLWDDVGGRTWSERAGPRTAVTGIGSRPRRGKRLPGCLVRGGARGVTQRAGSA